LSNNNTSRTPALTVTTLTGSAYIRVSHNPVYVVVRIRVSKPDCTATVQKQNQKGRRIKERNKKIIKKEKKEIKMKEKERKTNHQRNKLTLYS
jgi:hypothetical protein